MEADKNRFISEKNVLVAKRKELRKEIIAFQRNIPLSFVGPSNRGTEEIAFISGQDKLKTYILDAFDRTKGIFKGFLIQIKVYHQFYAINLPYPNNKV